METPVDPPAPPVPPGPGGAPGKEDAWQSFKVPVGEAPDGRLVRARRADPAVPYRCPGCASPLTLRAGTVRSAHFAHRSHGYCSGETALHQAAKQKLAQLLRKCLGRARANAPRLQVPCAGWDPPEGVPRPWTCGGEAWLALPDLGFDQVAVEPATAAGLRPDLLLLRRGEPVLGIEVLASHAVDAAKAARTPYPWVELEAAAILRAPRTWRPCQMAHPWRGVCRVCALAGGAELSELTGAEDCLAQLAAVCFAAQVETWLRRRASPTPAVAWRCPWCRRPNLRPLRRERVRGAALASGLGPPILPQVLLQGPAACTAVSFAGPMDPFRPLAIVPWGAPAQPALRATPGLDRPHRLALNGTNTPMAFLCRRCGRDCLGELPSPWMPLRPWQCL